MSGPSDGFDGSSLRFSSGKWKASTEMASLAGWLLSDRESSAGYMAVYVVSILVLA